MTLPAAGVKESGSAPQSPLGGLIGRAAMVFVLPSAMRDLAGLVKLIAGPRPLPRGLRPPPRRREQRRRAHEEPARAPPGPRARHEGGLRLRPVAADLLRGVRRAKAQE